MAFLLLCNPTQAIGLMTQMKKALLFLAVGGLATVSSAALACTQDELTKKATDLQTAIVAYMQKHPDKAQDLTAKSQAVTAKYQNASSLDDACKAYDELLESLK